jgi:Helicase associated domain
MFFLVPDYSANRALGKWVAKQREQHRALKRGEHSFLTPDRLEQLNNVGFVWSMKGRTPKEEDDAAAAMEDAAVAAAKAAVAAAVEAEEAERRQHQEDVAVAVVEAAMEADEEEVEDMGHPDDDEPIVQTSV